MNRMRRFDQRKHFTAKKQTKGVVKNVRIAGARNQAVSVKASDSTPRSEQRLNSGALLAVAQEDRLSIPSDSVEGARLVQGLP